MSEKSTTNSASVIVQTISMLHGDRSGICTPQFSYFHTNSPLSVEVQLLKIALLFMVGAVRIGHCKQMLLSSILVGVMLCQPSIQPQRCFSGTCLQQQLVRESNCAEQVLPSDTVSDCHMYLEGTYHTAGLGHSFVAFNHFLQLAELNNLTPRVYFETGGHGLDGEAVRSFFFHDRFYNGFHPSCKHTNLIRLKHYKMVKQAVKAMPSICAMSLGPLCTSFHVRDVPARNMNVDICKLRHQFAWSKMEDLGTYSIVVHIRRGDVLPGRHMSWNRWIPNAAYISILRDVLKIIQGRVRCKPVITLLVEKARSVSEVLDFDGVSRSDFNASLQDFPDVLLRLGADEAISDFKQMCSSNILVTGKSGFSYMAAILCPKPIVLAVPFWHSYKNVPNVISLSPNGSAPFNVKGATGTLATKYTIDGVKFGDLWKTRMQCLDA